MPELSKEASSVQGVPAPDTPPSGVKQPGAWAGYATVAGGWLAIFAAGMVLSSFGVFFKPVSAQFDWTRAETSGAFSLAQVMSGMAGIAAGRLGDRFNPRLIIVLCGAFLGTAYLLLSRIDALWQLYFYFGILVGCGLAVIIPVSSLIARTFAAQRGLFTGLTMSGGAVGTAIAAPLATLFINHYGWRGSYFAIGIIALVLGLITSACFYYAARFKPVSSNGFGAHLSRPRTEVSGSTLKQAFSSGQFWGLGMILFCGAFVLQTFSVHVIPRATDVGISAGDAALILSIGN